MGKFVDFIDRTIDLVVLGDVSQREVLPTIHDLPPGISTSGLPRRLLRKLPDVTHMVTIKGGATEVVTRPGPIVVK